MPPVPIETWHAFYAAAAATERSTNPSKTLRYATLMSSDQLPQVLEDLTDDHHLACILPTADGLIRLMHHFTIDRKTRMHPEGTDAVWGLVGTTTQSVALRFVLATPFINPGDAITVPPLETLLAVDSVDAVLEIEWDPDSGMGYDGLSIAPLPPFLTAAFMASGYDDAAKLCVVAAEAIAELENHLDSVRLDPTENPLPVGFPAAGEIQESCHGVLSFLWMVALAPDANIKAMAATVEPQFSGRCTDWANKLTNTTLSVRSLTIKTPHGHAPTESTAKVIRALGSELRDVVTTGRDRLPRSSSRKTGWARVSNEAKLLFLRASERMPPGSVDEAGFDMGGSVRTGPVSSVCIIFNGSTAAMSKMLTIGSLSKYPNITMDLPESTVVAVCEGLLLASLPGVPCAFSVFSCGPAQIWDASAAAFEDISADTANMKLSLATDEGKGLTDEQIDKLSRKRFSAPLDLSNLQAFLDNFDGLLRLCFGDNANVRVAVASWRSHIARYKTIYRILAGRDKLFPTKLLADIDHVVQVYLWSCLTAEHEDGIDTRVLDDFTADQNAIVRLRVAPGAVTAFVLGIYRRTCAQQADTVPELTMEPPKKKTNITPTPPDSHRNDRIAPGTKEAATKNYKALINKCSSAPLIGGVMPCFKFHINGHCNANCPRVASHVPPSPKTAKAFDDWVKSTTSV